MVSGKPFTRSAFQEFDNGQLEFEVLLNNGIHNGETKAYDNTGQLKKKETFKNGEIAIHKSYHKNECMSEEL